MNQPVVDAWAVPLEGDQFDLEDVPLWFTGHGVQITKHDEKFVIRIPASDIGHACEVVRPFAETLLEQINGAGSLLSPSFRPLTLSDRLFGLDSAGKVVNTVLALDGVEARFKGGYVVLGVNGKAPPDPRIGAALPLIRAAAKSDRAKDALIIVGRPNITWSELYVLYEFVKTEVGTRHMFDQGWISKPDENLFRRTANSYEVLRSKGRHGKSTRKPPAKPMTHSDAVNVIRNLVLGWLREVGA